MNWDELLCEDRVRKVPKRKESSDLRTEFEKDYHRIIGSASFRRLQDKTQVFPLDQSDFIRTRLTHSLEVSSFAKSLGQSISKKIASDRPEEAFDFAKQNAVCDILQCAGLLHDIGNPPFGHFGENVIRSWFLNHMEELEYKGQKITELLNDQMKADFYNFEGNTQALRLVSKLHYLVDEYGMNLTKGLLGTIIKYPVSSLEIDKKSGDIRTKKMGYFYAERALFQNLQKTMGTKGKRHPLAFVLEAADDIAYKTADIEDSFKKGYVTYEILVRFLKEYPVTKNKKAYNEMVEILEKKYQNALDNHNANPSNFAILNWLVQVQGRLLSGATKSFMAHYDEIMAGEFKGELLAASEYGELADALGTIAFKYAFTTKQIYKLEIAAETIMNFLMNKMVDAAIVYNKEGEGMTDVQVKVMSLISENYKAIYEIYSKGKSEEEKLYLRLMLVTDSICGMTDSYAKRLYQELSGII